MAALKKENSIHQHSMNVSDQECTKIIRVVQEDLAFQKKLAGSAYN